MQRDRAKKKKTETTHGHIKQCGDWGAEVEEAMEGMNGDGVK